MDSLVIFLVKNVVSAGILFLFYILVLRNRKFHWYNRFYLLGTLLISLLVPLINFRLYSFTLAIPKEKEVVNGTSFIKDIVFPGFSAYEIILFICGGISLLMMFCILKRIFWVYRAIRNHEVQRMDGYNFIESGLEAPFTFLDNLFWRKSISIKEDAGQKILAHELVHIRERHTYDKLFSQFVLCFFWINPIYWFIQRELNIVHEFLADAKSIREDDVASFAEMLLRSYSDGRYLDPVHPFFHSCVKRRLDMITRSGQSGDSYMRRIAAFPMICFIIALFSFTQTGMKVPDKTFRSELTQIKLPGAVIENDEIASVKAGIKDDIPPKASHLKKKASKNYKAVSSNENYSKQPDDKEKKHVGEDKLAGIEKLAELQKSIAVGKDKSQAPEKNFKDDNQNSGSWKNFYATASATKESLKPTNNGQGIKPVHYSEKQKRAIYKNQLSNEEKKNGFRKNIKSTS